MRHQPPHQREVTLLNFGGSESSCSTSWFKPLKCPIPYRSNTRNRTNFDFHPCHIVVARHLRHTCATLARHLRTSLLIPLTDLMLHDRFISFTHCTLSLLGTRLSFTLPFHILACLLGSNKFSRFVCHMIVASP